MENFHVVLVTARHHMQTSPVIRKLWDTSGYDVNIHLLDGTEGKSAVVNKMYRDLLPTLPDDDFYVIMDDDCLVPINWQGYIRQAFEDVYNLGAAGFMFDDTEQYRSYCAQWPELQQEGQTQFQEIFRGNLVGAFICSRVSVVRSIGEHPVDADIRYSFDEDGWRCYRVRQLGMRMVYIRAHTPALIQPMRDTEEYLAQKARDLRVVKERGLKWLNSK